MGVVQSCGGLGAKSEDDVDGHEAVGGDGVDNKNSTIFVGHLADFLYGIENACAGLMVNGSNLVFYETGVSGQSDIYYYDSEEDDSFVVSAEATDEQLLAVSAAPASSNDDIASSYNETGERRPVTWSEPL